MRNHRIFTLLVVLFIIGTITGITTLAGKSQQAQQSPVQATRIQDGVMTEKQRQHGKLYKGYGGGHNRIPDKLTRYNRNLLITSSDEVSEVPEFASLGDLLAAFSCNADAVVLGSPKKGTAQLNEDQDFIFTDYDFVADRVFKDNALSPIQTDSNITVTRTGGVVELSGNKVEAVDKSFTPFKIDKQYILFLKFIPATGAYQALYDRSFEIQNGVVRELGPKSISRYTDNPDTIVSETQAVSAAKCPH